MSVEFKEALLLMTAKLAAKKATRASNSAALSPSKKRKNKKKNQPGKYSQLVVETICRLGEHNSSSLAKIYTEAKVPWFDQQNGRTYLKFSIKALVQNNTLLQVKSAGANGSFKLNRKKLEGGREWRGTTAAATALAPATHKAKNAAPGAAGPQRTDKKPAKSQKVEKHVRKKGGASKKDKSSKAKKAAAPGGKKVKKVAKLSVPKVPKGRKCACQPSWITQHGPLRSFRCSVFSTSSIFETALAMPLLSLVLDNGRPHGYRPLGANGRGSVSSPGGR
ncbi:histone H1.10-like [Nycticebus coucang]|uniref:histone H1.10-like n=1 Tax=Nycticebus coucang TaxID=9470 RepID=UPI00234C7A54|nr:histone H1.10-like [Nycticebus coucang]